MAESSFGIKKIVDCRIGQDGKQMYKVKWEPTWEPYENLASCQHLIDQFWSYINKAKSLEQASHQKHKRPRLDLDNNQQNNPINLDSNSFNQHMLSEDSKAEVHQLIQRTNATQPGSMVTPSDMLNNPPNNVPMPRTPTHNNSNHNFMTQSPQVSPSPSKMNFGSPQQNFNSPSQRGGNKAGYGNKAPQGMKSEEDTVLSKKDHDNNNPFANWSSPYVTVHFKCRVCEKEMPKQSYWKRHFSFHVDGAKFTCQLCSKAFKQSSDLKRHEKIHIRKGEILPKTEMDLKEEFM